MVCVRKVNIGNVRFLQLYLGCGVVPVPLSHKYRFDAGIDDDDDDEDDDAG